jgi:flagellar biogenesis protein FliO
LPSSRFGDQRQAPNSDERNGMTIVGILIVIILVLLAIYLFQRVRTR